MRRCMLLSVFLLALVGLLVLSACGDEGDAAELTATADPGQATEPSPSSTAMKPTPAIESATPAPTPASSNETASEPLDVEDLEMFIPDAPSGWEGGYVYGWRCAGAEECSHTDAYGSYAATGSCDYATVAIMCFDRPQNWPDVCEWEGEGGYAKKGDVEGYPARLSYCTSEWGGDMYAYSVNVGSRIHVEVAMTTGDRETADRFVRMIDYDGLAALE